MSESSFQRPFDLNSISPEIKEQLDAIAESAAKLVRQDPKAFGNLMSEHHKILLLEQERQKEMYPPNPPNESCHIALINGILFSNETGLRHHDFLPYFRVGFETAYVWTHTQNRSSSLVVDVDVSVNSQIVWRNLASILELTIAISSSFENIADCDYDWIYSFNPKKLIKENKFLRLDNVGRLSGSHHRLSFLANHAPLIELLYRDERFYVMCMNLLTSFNNHHFCLICAFEKNGYQMHPNHELPRWQVAQAIPQMEVAIVQATRAIEAVLGKPGKRDVQSKYQRTLDRWQNSIDLEPIGIFDVAQKSNIDYYHEMFGFRGDAAHSLGSFPYELSRRLTIEAQCFAWVVMESYYQKNALNGIAAREALNFNSDLIEREPDNWSTDMTADSDAFPHEINN